MFEHFKDRMNAHRDRAAWEGEGRGPFGFGRQGGPFGRHGGPGRGGRGGRFFEHGGLKLIVLALIGEKPRHGYEIIKEIEDKVGGAYSPSPGVVYPTLTLLEETGQIEVASSEGGKKLYAITIEGRAALEANRAQIEAMMGRMSEAARDRDPHRDPRIMRAIENLRTALHFKLSSGRLGDEQVSALTRLLDETVAKIEAL